MKKLIILLGSGLVLGSVFYLGGMSTSASPYGQGSYGSCTYNNTCSISISTTNTISLAVEPTESGVFTIDQDEVDVTTNNTAGYTLTLESSSATDNALIGTVDEIPTTTGTPASPSALSGNEWGYRIDNFSSFGSGPTSSISNQSSTSLTFAGVPLLGDGAIIKTTASAAPSGEVTDVWYGIRADFDVAPDTYSQTVVYTAATL